MRMSWSSGLNDPFPAKQNAILRYSANISLDATSVVNVGHVFRSNSIFDPDYTAVGHQPYGHDQYAAIYKNYRVTKAVVTATSTSAGSNNILGITLRASPTIITDRENVREMKATRWTSLAGDPASRRIQLTSNLSDSLDPSAQAAVFGTNPDDQNYFHVWCAGNGSAEPAALAVAVDIVYYVEMWEPLALGIS